MRSWVMRSWVMRSWVMRSWVMRSWDTSPGYVPNVATMRVRVSRLSDLAHGMGKEAALWKAQEGPLLPLERKK